MQEEKDIEFYIRQIKLITNMSEREGVLTILEINEFIHDKNINILEALDEYVKYLRMCTIPVNEVNKINQGFLENLNQMIIEGVY